MANQTVVLTVTYGKRADYVSKMAQKLKEDTNVSKIVVVDNGSDNSIELDELAKQFGSLITIIHSEENNGSAAGFASGLQYIFENLKKADYIWLLDDDNLPSSECLSILLRQYRSCQIEKKIFAAFREDRKELLASGGSHYIPNSFFGFDLKTKLLFNKKDIQKESEEKLLACDTVPYGGLLLPMSIAKSNGLPNTNYVLYNDDNDYTYRLTKQGYQLNVCVDALIHDLESSWYRREQVPMFQGIFKTKMLRNAVYTIRNRTYFEKNNIVTNDTVYNLNILIYLIYVFLFYMPKTRNGWVRFVLVTRMIQQGLRGQLGPIKNTKYEYAVK